MGSVYAFTAHDADRIYLNGGKTYKVELPAPVPAKDFWSFTVYSTQHRSMLETDQNWPGWTAPSTQSLPTKTVRLRSGSAPKPRKGMKETGSRPFRTKASE